MCQNLCLHLVLLVSVLASGGETRSHGQLSGPLQDSADVGLELYNGKSLDSKTIGSNNNSSQPSTNSITGRISKQLISDEPSATAQPTTDSPSDSTGQPFTSVKPSATTHPTTDSPSDSTGQSFTSVKPSATSQPTPDNTYSGLYLYEASTRGDLASVNKALTAAGINLGWGNPDNQRATPLHAAAQFNHPDVVTALLNAGADKDRQDDNGQTPLYYSSRYGSIDSLNVLIAHGARIDIRDKYDKGTSLYAAVKYNHTAIIAVLLDAGAKINREQDDGGWTPLYYASWHGNVDAVSVLIARGASVDTPNNWGRTALHAAAGSNHKQIYGFNHQAIVTALLDAGAKINPQDDDGWTPLFRASGIGSFDAVSVLIARGARVDIPDKWGRTALHWAAWHNHPDIVSALLDAGADGDRQDDIGATAIYDASGHGIIDAVNILIARGADVNIPHSDGTTPVALASSEGFLHVVEALVAAKADVNIPNEDGFTALHQAIQNWGNNQLDITMVLLRSGADPSKQDNQGRTPAAFAQEEGHQELVDILNGFTKTIDGRITDPAEN